MIERLIIALALLTGPAQSQAAHLWVDTNGGSCSRNSTPAACNATAGLNASSPWAMHIATFRAAAEAAPRRRGLVIE